MKHTLDPTFTVLPYKYLAKIALEEAKKHGASYADMRFERLKTQNISMRNTSVERLSNNESIGYAIRLIHNGSWGFASNFTPDEATVRSTVAEAIHVATTLAPLNSETITQSDEATHQAEYISSYEINPFEVNDKDKLDFMTDINERVLRSGTATFVDFNVAQVLENKYFASSEGTETTQQRIRLHGNFEATQVDPATGSFESMRSLAAPVGRGWEYMTSGYDFVAAAEEIPKLLAEKVAAPSVVAGRYDLVIDPTNLWLTIHESVGHATEFDRVLGYEANYAGTSFATLDKLGSLQYGSKYMNIIGDRVTEHGLSTVGFDDEGVAGQSWDIIKNGVLVGYQLNRQMASKLGLLRSNGCAFADSPTHVPIQRMANVSLKASGDDISTEDLIAKVKKGIYIIGDKSWSIDMQRYNFQFTGQQFYEIRDGKIVGQLKDVAYQATTTEFWNSLDAVGGKDTYVLGGAFNCGKGQPGQVAPVSHGCPSTLFRNINILNTTAESK